MRKKLRTSAVLICYSIGVTIFLMSSMLYSELSPTTSPCPTCSQPEPEVTSNYRLAWVMKTSKTTDDINKCLGKFVDFDNLLNFTQKANVDICIASNFFDVEKGIHQEFKERHLRYTSHGYLNSTKSFMIEVGGHLGSDVNEFNSRYHPETYIVLEPIRMFYKHLQQRFNNSNNIIFLNYGLDVEDGEFMVDSTKNDGTSIFGEKANNSLKNDTIKVMSVSKFFHQLKIDEKNIDLLTMNCEGCEYAVLDYLLSSGKINLIRNIQFQSHGLSGICQPLKRYCWYQELLPKSHKLVFRFKFIWQSWSRL